MKLAAVIVETRIFPLDLIVKNHLDLLPECDLFVYCSQRNQVYFKGIPAQYFHVTIGNLLQYNLLLTSSLFWDRLIKYDKVLIFQSDSEILRPGIEEFYEWDYVGSPWKFQHHGGNGGLSLRDPRAMRETILRIPYTPGLGFEDVYFCNAMRGKLAPREICEKFSCETIFKLGTWGAHNINNYLTKDQCYEIRNQYR